MNVMYCTTFMCARTGAAGTLYAAPQTRFIGVRNTLSPARVKNCL